MTDHEVGSALEKLEVFLLDVFHHGLHGHVRALFERFDLPLLILEIG